MSALLIVFPIICLAAMSGFIYFEKKEQYASAVVFKGIASLLFVAFAFANISMMKNKGLLDDINKSIQLLIGLGLGMLGDIFLNLRFVLKGKASNLIFLVGVFTFLAGHILYLVHLLGINKLLLVNNYNNLIYIPIIIAIVIGGVIAFLIFKFLDAKLANKIVGTIYVITVSFVACVSLFNLIVAGIDKSSFMPYYSLMFVGSFSFFISDIILIFNSFGKNPKFPLRIANLSCYYVGQLLIAFSIYLLYFVK